MNPSLSIATLQARNLGINLIRHRQARGLTQEELADLCRIPRSTLTKLESGRSNPTLGVLVRIARALQMPLERLLSAPASQCQIFPREEISRFVAGTDGKSSLHSIIPVAHPGLDVLRLELAPQDQVVGERTPAGSRRIIYCEKGTLAIRMGAEGAIIAGGELAVLHGDEIPIFINRAPTSQTLVFIVIAQGNLP